MSKNNQDLPVVQATDEVPEFLNRLSDELKEKGEALVQTSDDVGNETPRNLPM